MGPEGAAAPGAPVLIVEDDDDIRTMLSLTLAAYGYAVEAADDGEHALGLLRAEPRPGVVLVDLMMPGMSGEDLIRRMRADPAAQNVPIVLFSGHSTLAELARSLAVDNYLAKPVDVDQLLRVVSSFCTPTTRH